MKNEEINRAIAEHVGTADQWLIVKRGYFYRPDAKGYTAHEPDAWKLPLAEAKKYEYLIGDEPVTLSRASIPNYAEDLNAMHEAEKKIVDWVFWRIQLSHVVGIGYAPDLDICEDIKSFASATAHQRAEAFLRTIGKWVE